MEAARHSSLSCSPIVCAPTIARHVRTCSPCLRYAWEQLIAVIDEARPGAVPAEPATSAEREPAPSTGDEVPVWTLDDVERLVTELLLRYPVRRDLREDPPEATRLAVHELLALGLVRSASTAEGTPVIVAVPALARYRRPVEQPVVHDTDQLDLFGGG